MEKNKTQSIFLQAAGFTVKLTFEPTEATYFKRRLLAGIDEVWGKSGFLVLSKRAWDFEIRFRGGINQIEALEQKGKKRFFLAFEGDFSRRKVDTFYTVSLPEIELLIREVFALLLKKRGFLLHAASCLDEEGTLRAFLAPSGGGKTTAALLLSKKRGIESFSDDILIIRRQKGRWVFYSPPFVEKGNLPVKRKARKGEFYFVRKAKSPAKEEIKDKNQVLKLILSEIWLPTDKLERKTLAKVMAFVRDEKFYVLQATLNSKAIWRVLDEG